MDNNKLEQQSEFIKKSKELLSEISEKFKPFAEEYDKVDRNETKLEELRKKIQRYIFDSTDLERYELNYMNKMLSKSNCWYAEYRVGEIIHEECMKIWYGDRKSPIG